MRYRVVQRRIVELDESKDYSAEQLEAHRRANPEVSRVVWQGDRNMNFGEKFLQDPKWHTDDQDLPCDDGTGWVSYYYRLERYDGETRTWQFVCHVEPVCDSPDVY